MKKKLVQIGSNDNRELKKEKTESFALQQSTHHEYIEYSAK